MVSSMSDKKVAAHAPSACGSKHNAVIRSGYHVFCAERSDNARLKPNDAIHALMLNKHQEFTQTNNEDMQIHLVMEFERMNDNNKKN